VVPDVQARGPLETHGRLVQGDFVVVVVVVFVLLVLPIVLLVLLRLLLLLVFFFWFYFWIILFSFFSHSSGTFGVPCGRLSMQLLLTLINQSINDLLRWTQPMLLVHFNE
jgi:hypothetical protein